MRQLSDYALITLEDLKYYLEISEDDTEFDYLFENLINRSTDAIQEFCRRRFISRTYTKERYDGKGSINLYLKDWPVTALAFVSIGLVDIIQIKYGVETVFNAYATVSTTGITLTVESTSGDELTFADYTTMATMAAAINGETSWEAEVLQSLYSAWPSSLLMENRNVFAAFTYGCLSCPAEPIQQYTLDHVNGIITYSGVFPEGTNNIIASSTAGYTIDNIPEVIQEATIRLIASRWQESQTDLNMKSEKELDYSFTRKNMEEALSASTITELKTFRRIKV